MYPDTRTRVMHPEFQCEYLCYRVVLFGQPFFIQKKFSFTILVFFCKQAQSTRSMIIDWKVRKFPVKFIIELPSSKNLGVT